MTECSHCRKRYENGVRFCPVDGFAVVPVTEPLIGRTLMGQFQIQSVCGHGATGTVYRATQVGIDREVAVKILKADLLKDPDVIKRFVREARAGARLSHPNIATVHLVGQTDDGVPFLVMEFVEGVALSALVGVGKPLPLRRLVHIGAQISSALAEAHGQGIVHRDLKPENILLTERRGESDVVKVVDFGIAKMVAHAAPGEDPISRLGTVFGTPHYIAPEQASGQAVDGRADIYSLGCILFQMATGRVPFDGQQGLQVLLRQVRDPVPDPRSLNPRISDRLATLILKMLAKEPAQRPQAVHLVTDALRDLEPGDGAGATVVSAAVARPGVVRSGGAALRAESGRGQPAPRPAPSDDAPSDDAPSDDWYQQDEDASAEESERRPSERELDSQGAARRRRRREGSERESRSGNRRPSRSGRSVADSLPFDQEDVDDRRRPVVGFWRRSWMPIVGIASAVALGTLAGLLYAHFHAAPPPAPPPPTALLPPPAAPATSLVRSSGRPAAARPSPPPPASRPIEPGLPVTVFPAGPPLTGPQPLGPGPLPAPSAPPVPAAAPAPPSVAAPAPPSVAAPPAASSEGVAPATAVAASPPPAAAPALAKPPAAAEPVKIPPPLAAKPDEPPATPPVVAAPAADDESGSDPYHKLK